MDRDQGAVDPNGIGVVLQHQRNALPKGVEEFVEGVARCEDALQIRHVGPIGPVFAVDLRS